MRFFVKSILFSGIILLLISSAVTLSDSDCDAFSTSGSCGDSVHWEYIDDSNTLVIRGTGNMKDYFESPWDDKTTFLDGKGGKFKMTIDTIEFKGGVKSIGNYAFKGLNVKNLIMTDSIVDVGTSAFENCKYLSSIDLSNSLETISDNAFKSCSLITTLDIPDSIKSISNSSFDNCNGLTTIIFPDHLQSIPHLEGCTKLSSIHLPNNIRSIDGDTLSTTSNVKLDFTHCDQLLQLTVHNWKQHRSFTIPNSVTDVVIKSNTLKNLYIGDSVESIKFHWGNSLENFYVSNSNSNFKSIDGVLYSSDMKTMWFPFGRNVESYSTPDIVENIEISNQYIKYLTITENVKKADVYCTSLQIANVPSNLKSGISLPDLAFVIPYDYKSTSSISGGIIIKYYSSYIDTITASKVGNKLKMNLFLEDSIPSNYTINIGSEYGSNDVMSTNSTDFYLPDNITDYVKVYLTIDAGQDELPPAEWEDKSDEKSIWDYVRGIGAVGIFIIILIFTFSSGIAVIVFRLR